MRAAALTLVLCPFLAASAFAEDGGLPVDAALKQALAEQASADAETARLERAASQARTEADRLHAEQLAAAQAIDAAEARISAANARLQLVSAYVAAHQRRLAAEQQPVSSLLAGLATMARRPPLLVLADRRGTDELVEVRLLLDSTLPVIRSRTAQISAQLAQGQELKQATLAARSELASSHNELVGRQKRYALLEQKAVQEVLTTGGQALGSSDVAMAAQEYVERLRGEQANNQSIRRLAEQLANEDAAPASPFPAEGPAPRPPFAYQLPAAAPVLEGFESVDDSGVRARGVALATARGAAVTAPAGGVVKFSGPFRDYDGVLIIDHGGGWLSLIVNVGSALHPGDHVAIGQQIGRALGPLQVQLSQNGHRISPALIAGSFQTMSKDPKGS